MVPWMSGLVNGLQNRLRRFESARHLRVGIRNGSDFIFLLTVHPLFRHYFDNNLIFFEKKSGN